MGHKTAQDLWTQARIQDVSRMAPIVFHVGRGNRERFLLPLMLQPLVPPGSCLVMPASFKLACVQWRVRTLPGRIASMLLVSSVSVSSNDELKNRFQSISFRGYRLLLRRTAPASLQL
jgi:hypothetical protein